MRPVLYLSPVIGGLYRVYTTQGVKTGRDTKVVNANVFALLNGLLNNYHSGFLVFRSASDGSPS